MGDKLLHYSGMKRLKLFNGEYYKEILTKAQQLQTVLPAAGVGALSAASLGQGQGMYVHLTSVLWHCNVCMLVVGAYCCYSFNGVTKCI